MPAATAPSRSDEPGTISRGRHSTPPKEGWQEETHPPGRQQATEGYPAHGTERRRFSIWIEFAPGHPAGIPPAALQRHPRLLGHFGTRESRRPAYFLSKRIGDNSATPDDETGSRIWIGKFVEIESKKTHSIMAEITETRRALPIILWPYRGSFQRDYAAHPDRSRYYKALSDWTWCCISASIPLRGRF